MNSLFAIHSRAARLPCLEAQTYFAVETFAVRANTSVLASTII
jgi:hypothetical protein